MMQLRSQPRRNAALSGISVAVGALLVYFGRHHADTNAWAGYLLGWLMLLLGLAALLVNESRQLELDTRRRLLVLDVRRRLGGNRRVTIPFSQITSVDVSTFGSRSDGSVYYDLVVRTLDGRSVYLMGGCAFEGRMNRDYMERLRDQFMHVTRGA